jgi:hypothetical protein
MFVPQSEPSLPPFGHEFLAGLRERDQGHAAVVWVRVAVDDPVARKAVEHCCNGGRVEVGRPGQLTRRNCIFAVESKERPQLGASEVPTLLVSRAQPSFRSHEGDGRSLELVGSEYGGPGWQSNSFASKRYGTKVSLSDVEVKRPRLQTSARPLISSGRLICHRIGYNRRGPIETVLGQRTREVIALKESISARGVMVRRCMKMEAG